VGAVARQMEQLRKESGRLSSTEQKSVEAKIKASLKTGDYATTSPIEVGDTTERRDYQWTKQRRKRRREIWL
ncbi:MAG: hypothetical protein IKO40_04340, partial [Kiritimatiellae bacterium]|nr:hypothetical protein [Kiritimatiellia bacterium]